MFEQYPAEPRQFVRRLLAAEHRDAVLVKPPLTATSDLDVCASDSGMTRLRNALAALGQDDGCYPVRCSLKAVSLQAEIVFVGAGASPPFRLVLDVRRYVGDWPHKVLFDADTALRWAESRDGVLALRDAPRLLYFFQHIVLTCPGRLSRYGSAVAELVVSTEDLDACLADAGPHFARSFRQRLLQRNFGPLTAGERVGVCGAAVRALPRTLKQLLRYTRARSLVSPDLVVLCGCDGAGKSTLVEKAAEELQRCGMDQRTFHFNRDLGVINVGTSVQKRDKQTIGAAGEDPHERRATALENVCRLLSAVDRWLGLTLRRLLAGGNTTFLLDRYFIDYFLRDRIVKVAYSRVLRLLMFRAFPKPDSMVYVYASPERIAERKMEYGSTDQIRREIGLYRRYLRRVYAPVCLLRNDDLDAAVSALVRQVLEARAGRCRTILRRES